MVSSKVGGCQKQNVAQIERNLDIVVGERLVLLAVQHLQHGSEGRQKIIAHLVHFVQQNKRVAGAGVNHCADHSAGHGADVCLAMSADVRFVPHTAQRDALVLAPQRFGNGLANGGFAHAGRTDEAEDLSPAHPDSARTAKLQNSLLDLCRP